MDSGIKMNDACVDAVNNVEKRQSRFCVIKFDENYGNLVLDQISSKEASFTELLAVLPKNRVRYVFFDCQYTKSNGQKNERVLFVSWCPDADDTPQKEKMLCSSTLKRVTTSLRQRYKHMEIHDWEEMTEENFINVVSQNKQK